MDLVYTWEHHADIFPNDTKFSLVRLAPYHICSNMLQGSCLYHAVAVICFPVVMVCILLHQGVAPFGGVALLE